MRNASIKVGLLVCAFMVLSAQNTHALAGDEIKLTGDPYDYSGVVQSPEEDAPEPKEKKQSDEKKIPETPKTPEPLKHTVVPGDSLIKIGEQYQVEWTRIFDKNLDILNPDTINPGQTLLIPTADEQLAKRELPQFVPAQVITTASTRRTVTTSVRQSNGGVAGNTYTPGYCTWYAKNKRPDLPNRMGNASSWVSSAAAQGFTTGSIPQVGAIGQQGNHVVYVESVNSDGTVTVSEMNWSGLFVVSTRTVPAGNFRYIY